MAMKLAYGATGVTLLGSDAAPLALGATGGATDVATWTHNYGQTAEMVEVLSATNHAVQANTVISVTQPTVNSMVISNLTAGALNVIVRIQWATRQENLTAPVAYNDASIVLT